LQFRQFQALKKSLNRAISSSFWRPHALSHDLSFRGACSSNKRDVHVIVVCLLIILLRVKYVLNIHFAFLPCYYSCWCIIHLCIFLKESCSIFLQLLKESSKGKKFIAIITAWMTTYNYCVSLPIIFSKTDTHFSKIDSHLCVNLVFPNLFGLAIYFEFNKIPATQ